MLLLMVAGGNGAWAATTTKYERGGVGTVWSGYDLSDWTAVVSGSTFAIDGGLKTGAGNAGYEYRKELPAINPDARLTISGTWNTGTSLGRDASYNYLRFGNIELRSYGQWQRGSIVINGEETFLTYSSGDVRDDKDWTFSITVTQETGAVSYSVTMPAAGTVAGTGNVSVLDLTDIRMGFLKTASVYDNHQTLKQISISEETYSYTVSATGSLSQSIATGNDGPNANMIIPYHRYILDGTTLHRADRQGSDPHYGVKFTLDSDAKAVSITYAKDFDSNGVDDITNVAVFREAEDFMTPADNTYVANRCSNQKGGYSATAQTVATLPSGAYIISAASYGRPTNFVFSSGGVDKWTHSALAWGENSSETLQLAEGALQVSGGSSSYPLDYVYVQRVFAYETASSNRTQGETPSKPTLVNTLDGYTVAYTTSNSLVATVNASGDISFLHNGTAVITATATKAASPTYTTTHTVTITGESLATSTWNRSVANQETYTLSGTGYINETYEGERITISYGSPTETQTVSADNAYCIDAYGFSHVFLNANENATGVPTMGTYYTFVPKENGKLTINALVSEDGAKGRNGLRLVDGEGNILERITSIGSTYQDYAFNTLLIAGRTYYVFAETGAMETKLDDDAFSTLWLHSFTFTKVDGVTISLIDQSLLFTPGDNSNSNRLDRQIPGFNITFGGGDGAKYNGNGTFIFRNKLADSETENGSITITPRLSSGSASDVHITQVVLNTGDPIVGSPYVYVNDEDKGPVTANSTLTFSLPSNPNTVTIKLKGTGVSNTISFLLNSLTVHYTTDNGAVLDTRVSDQVELKFANDYIYGYVGDAVENDIYFDKPKAFYGDVNFSYSNPAFSNGCTNAVTKYKEGDEKVHLNDGNSTNPYKVRIGQGVGTLTASFAETAYFNATSATTRLYSRDYVENCNKVLAIGESYTVPAGAHSTISVTTSGGSISLTNTDANPTTLLANDEVFTTSVLGEANTVKDITITNTGVSDITIKTIEVARKKATLNYSYSGAVGPGSDVLFNGWSYLPATFSVSGETGVADKYETTGTYSITQSVNGVTLVSSSTGELSVDQDADRGLLQVVLTVNPKAEYRYQYAPITKTITLKVVDGMWDFRPYSLAEHRTIYNSSDWYGQYTGWYATRDNAEFAAFLRNSDNDNTPLPRALSLEAKGRHRLLHTDHGYLHLQGKGNGVSESPNGGGQLRVPVKAGMLVELNCYSEDLMSEMEITGVTDLDHNEVTSFFVNNDDTESQFFIATANDYIVVKNPSSSLDLHIRYIKVSADMAFEYGNLTYIDANVGTWSNPVMNQGTTTIGYTYTNDISTPVNNIGSDGVVTIGSGQYGKFTVTATGSGSGVLAGKTGVYQAYAIGLTRNGTSSSASIDDTGKRSFDLKTLFDIAVGGTGLLEADLKNLMTFTVLDESPTVLLSGSTLTIEGVQTVRVKATLGAIERVFTCEVTGGTLADGLNPVIENDATSYTITITGESRHKFYLKNMYDGIMGDIAANKSSLVFENYDDPENPVTLYVENTEVSCSNLRISGFSTIKKGGVIPIYAGYTHSETNYNIEGTLTVAYTSHEWDFTPNLIATYGHLRGWTTADGSSTAAWNSTYATIDEPTDAGTRSDSYDWKFTRKIGNKTNTSKIFYYNHSVEGQNALVIPETEGLHLYASPSNKQMGIEMTKDEAPYECRNLMLLRGGKLTIPKLKAGQWVEVRWNRHTEDMGERILMENLSDAEGTPIISTYKIGNCFYNLGWGSSTYMFQATEDGDVTFEIADNIYVNIQKIILHERDWSYHSSLDVTLRGYDDLHTPTEDTKAGWTGETASTVDWVYLWNDDAASHTLTILSREYQNAPNAPQTWSFEMDEMLTRSGAEMTTTGIDGGEATITYNGGWGKVKVTMTSYSQNMKYVANKRTWTITFGQKPKQTYPYTWDFTKFFSSTNSSMGNDLTWANLNYSGTANPLRIATYNNHTSTDYSQYSNSYNTSDYQAYYVEGGQLVSYGLRNINNGVIRETAGLGFKLDADGDAYHKPDENMLMLNMTKTVVSATQASNEQTWNSDTGETDAARHTDNSHLTIGTGGKIIVPKPNDAVNYDDYYIYIKSSHAPAATTNVTDCSTDAEVPTGVYKYQFSANADAEFTFTSSDEAVDGVLKSYASDPAVGRKYTDIYAIAVTNEFKTVKRLDGVGWATESRNYTVDYTLDSLLTNRPLQVYSIISRSSNPMYSYDKARTTVRLIDRAYVPPANQGLILKQATSSPGADGTTYDVPLFVPAVTTAAEYDYAYTNNLLKANLTATTLTEERCDFNGTDNAAGNYVRFILAEKYMTWKKDGTSVGTPDNTWHSNAVPGFYRLHLYTSAEASALTPATTDDALNTLGANTAYLILPYDNINPAIWESGGGAKRFDFIGIAGVSDMLDDEITESGKSDDEAATEGAVYNMRGQRVDADRLQPGIYIRNGKKFIVR